MNGKFLLQPGYQYVKSVSPKVTATLCLTHAKRPNSTSQVEFSMENVV